MNKISRSNPGPKLQTGEDPESLVDAIESVAGIGTYRIDLHSNKIYFSKGMYNLLGEEPLSFEPDLDVIDSRSVPDDAVRVRQILEQAKIDKLPYYYIRRFCRNDGRWITVESHGKVILDARGEGIAFFGVVQDITDRVNAQEKLTENRELLRTTINSSLDMIQVFQAVRNDLGEIVDFIWILNNQASEQIYGDVIGKSLLSQNPEVKEIGIFNTFKQVVETGLPDKSERHYVYEQFDSWFEQSVVKLNDGVATTIRDITERKKQEWQLQEEHRRFKEAQSIGHVGSFEWDIINDKVYWSDEMYRIHGIPRGEEITIQKILDTIHPESRAELTQKIAHCKREICTAYLDHKITRRDGEERTVNRSLQSFGNASGTIIKISGTVQDITERKKAQEEIVRLKEEIAQKRSEEKFRNFIRASSSMVYRMSADWSRMENLVGRDLLADTLEPIHNWVDKYILPEDQSYVDKTIQTAITNKTVFELEHRVRLADGSVGWVHSRAAMRSERFLKPVNRILDLYAFPLPEHTSDRVAVIFMDVTERKLSERKLKEFSESLEKQVLERTRQLRESKERFEAAMYVSPTVLCILRNVLNDQDEVVDFSIEWISRSGTRLIGKDASGGQLIENFPFLANREVIDKLLTVTKTGTPTDFEHLYRRNSRDLWIRWRAVRLEEGLLLSVEDITDRKEGEAAVSKNLAILKQSEQVASIGSWEYDISSKEMRWSEGMYHLFGLAPGSKVSPYIYLDFATNEQETKAKDLINKITKEFIPFEGEITIQVGLKSRCLQIKAVPYRDEFGKSLKMLGVDIDITDRKEAESKLRRAEIEKQNAILNAVMETQEEERRRIAEALHNEFGQLLTATKYQIQGKAPEAENLLGAAINVVRSISHELMPPILQDYGLEIALKDLFDSKMLESDIKYQVRISGLKKRINPITEIALFRIIQEIVNNIVKHSKALRVDAIVERHPEDIAIRISDNGIGMKEAEQGAKRKSFGLSYIYNRVHLLKGEISIESEHGKGTSLNITIPFTES